MLGNFICNIFFVILDYRAAPILGTYHSAQRTHRTYDKSLFPLLS